MKKVAGSALVYILIAIALMGALTVTFMNSDSQQSRTQNAFKIGTNVASQIQYIRSAIEACVLTYPRGDNNISDTGYVAPYPPNPDSDYYDGSTLGEAADKSAKYIRCPGNGSGNNHSEVFTGSSGYTAPATIDLLQPWLYFNGSQTISSTTYTGVYLMAYTTKSDPFIGEAFSKVDGKFSQCEIDAVTPATDDECDAITDATQCLRYWIIRTAPSCP